MTAIINPKNQEKFSIKFSGTTEMPISDSDPYGPTFTIKKSRTVKGFKSLHEAMFYVHKKNKNDDYAFFEEFVGDDSDSDDENYDSCFKPRSVSIFNREGKLVIGGEIESRLQNGEATFFITWLGSICDEESRKKVEDKISELYAQAAFESSWDNYGSALDLKLKAEKEKLFLSCPEYRDQIKNFLMWQLSNPI